MLQSIKEITNYVLLAEDGEIGRCKDFLFDDQHWTIRYMVADTAKWLPGRKVLISPISLGKAKWVDRRFAVHLTKAQIKDSPPIDEHQPVSRQYERKYFGYYRYPYYWGGTNIWGVSPYPYAVPPQSLEPTPEEDKRDQLVGAFCRSGPDDQSNQGEPGIRSFHAGEPGIRRTAI